MDYLTIIGFAASFLSSATFVPQIFKAIKTKRLEDVAWGMLILNDLAAALWLIYGINLEIHPLILSSSVVVFSSSLLLILKSIYKR